MAGEAEELEAMAVQLDIRRARVEDDMRRLSLQAEQEIALGRLGWKGPSATRFLQDAQDKQLRMRAGLEQIAMMAENMRRAAQQIRQAQAQGLRQA